MPKTIKNLILMMLLTGLLAVPLQAGVWDNLLGHSGPPTLADVARLIDGIQESLVNQGTVVVKQPDIWSQARMTKFRLEYEDTMAQELTKFQVYLSGRIARSDAASLSSQTALAASLTPQTPGNASAFQLKDFDAVQKERGDAVAILGGAATTGNNAAFTSPGSSTFPTNAVTSNFALLNGVTAAQTTADGKLATNNVPYGLEPNVTLDERGDYISHLHRLRRINLGDDNADSAGYGMYLMRVPLSIQPGDKTKMGFGAIANLTISHDFTPRYLQTTYRNLVINDLVDKLTPIVHELIRSGQASEFGAYMNRLSTLDAMETSFRERSQGYVHATKRDVERALRNLVAAGRGGGGYSLNRSGPRLNAIAPSDVSRVFLSDNLLILALDVQSSLDIVSSETIKAATADAALVAHERRQLPVLMAASSQSRMEAENAYKGFTRDLQNEDLRNLALKNSAPSFNGERQATKVNEAIAAARNANQDERAWTEIQQQAQAVQDAISNDSDPLAKSAGKVVDATARHARDLAAENQARTVVSAAEKAEEPSLSGGDQTRILSEEQERSLHEVQALAKKVRMTDVRAYLRNELEAAYDMLDGHCKQGVGLLQDIGYIESLVDRFNCREFDPPPVPISSPDSGSNAFAAEYDVFTSRLPGNVRDQHLGVLAWGIALEAGLLNRHLHDEMKQTKGANDYSAPPDVDEMAFYAPEPTEEVVQAFQAYIRARWPMLTFALEPVVDQQNIDDAFTRRRDLQLAIAFALASGRIAFRQAITFTRQLQYEAQTIALNQTVSAFANGNDTFGWRVTPRYQTPPEESNFRAATGLLFRGGTGPNWQLDHSKIEPGMRELTAVVVMPSFVQGIRVDVASNWFRLHDPDERKLKGPKMVELGRRINEARDCLEAACKCGKYRPEDLERLRVRLHQLETMLPLQTSFVRVPYENTLGGFALFSQGKTDLVPELLGYDGLDSIDPSRPTDLMLYGKHFSLYEMSVVVGGKTLLREGTGTFFTTGADGKTPVMVTSTVNPVRDKDGNLIVQAGTGTTPIPDNGTYLIQSREVMRVRIPRGVATVRRSDGTEAVEVTVSTPTGISGRLLIPVLPTPPTAAAGAPTSATIVDSIVSFRYQATLDPSKTPPVVAATGNLIPATAPASLRILPADTTNLEPVANVAFSFPLATPNSTVLDEIVIPNVALTQANKCYTLTPSQLDELARQIEMRLKNGKMPIAIGTTFKSRRVVVQPVPASGKFPPAMTTSNDLVINYEFVLSQVAGSQSTAVASIDPVHRDPAVVKTSADEAEPTALRASYQEPLPQLPFPTPDEGPRREANPKPEVHIHIPSPITVSTPTPTSSNAAPGQAATSAPPTAAAPGQAATQTQAIVLMPRSPIVNVAVPITNVAKPRREGFFRHEPATPQNPQRPSLLQRLVNGP